MVEPESLLHSLACIKHEIEDVNFDEEYHQGTKCGSIFYSKDRKYTFICEFCGESSHDMEQLGHHLEAKHLGSEDTISNLQEVPEKKQVEVRDCSNRETDPLQDKNITEESIPSIQPDTHDANFIDDKLYCVLCDRHYRTISSFNQHKSYHFLKGTILVEKKKAKKAQESKLMSRKVPSEGTKQREMLNTSTCEQTVVRNEDEHISANAKVAEKPDIICEFCSGICKTDRLFRKHVVTRHGNLIPKVLKDDPTYLTCDWCNQQYETPLERHQHEKTHKGGDLFLCPLCPKNFRSRGFRQRHVNIHKGIRPHTCPHCPMAFSDPENLKRHIRVHLGIKPYACDYCDKRFTTSTLKKDHTKTHTKEKPYQCAQCGLRFRMRGSFHKHVSTHHIKRTRDFKCDQCGKAYLDDNQMKEHRKTHSDLRPHVCSECGATFKLGKTLKIHKQLHSDVKRHECKVCNKRFAQVAGLYSHMKSHREELD